MRLEVWPLARALDPVGPIHLIYTQGKHLISPTVTLKGLREYSHTSNLGLKLQKEHVRHGLGKCTVLPEVNVFQSIPHAPCAWKKHHAFELGHTEVLLLQDFVMQIELPLPAVEFEARCFHSH